MVKKVRVDQLKPGMFVSDFNCSWLDHPFFTNTAKLRDDKMIQKIIKNGIREVYIDTKMGIDVADAMTADEVNRGVQKELTKVVEEKVENNDRVSFEDEINMAKRIKSEAKNTVSNIMKDIKEGKEIETEYVEHIVGNMVDSVFRNQDALLSLGAIRKLDDYTYHHSVSVCTLMISFARSIGADTDTLKKIGMGALLHDIGKTLVPPEIMNKKGRLSDEDYIEIKKHPEHSYNLLKKTPGTSELMLLMAYEHHERSDGKGYPRGLKNDDISLYGRAIAIVDVYDAITSDKCYKNKIHPTHAMGKLMEWGGYEFDKTLVQKFIRCIGIYPLGSVVLLESGMIGIVIRHGEENILKPVVRIVYNMKKEYYVEPYDVDLSLCETDSVISTERPEKWKIRPEMYL